MRKSAEIKIPEFEIQPNIEYSILEHLRKNKKTTQTIIAHSIKCSPSSARENLNRLVSNGTVKDLGLHRVNGKKSRVYEIV